MSQADENCLKDPGWAAVIEARRSVNIAWISAAVNFMVVIVALLVPLYQNYLDRKMVRENYYQQKIALVRQARKILDDGVKSQNSLGIILDPKYDVGVDLSKNLRLEVIDSVDSTFSTMQEEMRFLLSSEDADIDYRSFVTKIIERINHLRSAVRRTKFIINNTGDKTISAVSDSGERFKKQYVDDLKSIRLLVDLNTDARDRSVRSGPIIYGECDENIYVFDCAKPFKASHQ